MDVKAALSYLKIDIKSIPDENLRGSIILLLNAVEQLSKENGEQSKTIQTLMDEINRLKGEQGKPTIRAQKKGQDISSESERKKDKEDDNNQPPKNAKPQKAEIPIDQVEYCDVNKEELPPDAVFKGYESMVVQDIKMATHNILFKKATYYSASQKKTYMGSLPIGYQGQFGPGVKSLVLDLYQNGGMTEPALKRFLETHGLYISSGTLSKIITNDVEIFHSEKTAIVNAGLEATDYQHLDDTGSRVNGKNYHTHVLCNPFFTAYFTLPTRDRLAAIEVLSNGKLIFCLDEEAYQLMKELGLSDKWLNRLRALNIEPTPKTPAEMDALIQLLFPKKHRHQTNQKLIREVAAIVAYQRYGGQTKILLTDGALQFQLITEHQGLCWVHEGRHYKKLNPVLAMHREALEDFRQLFWDFYRELQNFKKRPTQEEAERLSAAFDEIFSRKTDYQDLDDRIASTLSNKKKLLLVLRFPYLPLHNNPAELGARVQARKRDISLQTKNAEGTKSKDTLMTIVETAKKLGVNTFRYIYDRLSGKYEMPSLADLIRQRSAKVAFVNTA